jgi:hypothetical protein
MPTSKLTRTLLVAAAAAAISLASGTAALADPTTDAGELLRQSERDTINQPPQTITNAGDLFRQSEVNSINQPPPTPAPAPDATRHRLNGLILAAGVVLLGVVTAAAAWWATGRRLRPRQLT